jgi:hypothetical protein
MGKVPYPPFQKRLLSPKIGAGMDSGQTHRTGISVGHSMLGSLTGTDAYFRLAWVEAATHWGIGGSLDGEFDGVIYQWVEMGSMLIPWASGPWNAPGYGDGGKFVKDHGVYCINACQDSVELSGQLNTKVTVKQWQQFIWLLAAIAHDGGLSAEEFLHNHHREFCTPSYKDCPFPRVYNYTNEYMHAVVQIMQHYEGKSGIPESASIAGMTIPLPLHQGSTEPLPQDSHAPIFIPFENPRKAIVGNCTERQYGNTQAKIYQSLKAGTKVEFVGYYNGQEVNGSRKWYVRNNDRKGRIHESGIDHWL